MEKYFPNAGQMMGQLKAFGQAYKLEFNKISMVPNTNKALRLAEYAKEVHKIETYSKLMYQAVFVKDLNIGLMSVLYDIGAQAGISRDQVDQALANPLYEKKLQDHIKYCRDNQIQSVPTFIINDQEKIVGAASPETFEAAFKKIQT